MKILFHYDAGSTLRKSLEDLDNQGINVVCCPEGPDEPFFTELRSAKVLWHVLHPIDATVIARAPQLKLIQKIGVGVNTIDLEAAQDRGIAVCNMPGTNSRAVAEMTLLLMLSTLRRLVAIDRSVREGRWSLDQEAKESFGEIAGRTIGIVGFGEVPGILAPILTAMGARVIYTSRNKKRVPYDHVSMDELLAESDVVTLHVPLTTETVHLLDASRIERMKPGAVLINTARGGLVDEDALYSALTSGGLAGAGLDVFADEPVNPDNPLLSLEVVTASPHVAWLTNETFARSIEIAVRNSRAALGDGEFIHRVV
ncbi:MAG: NAD(P)-dependent oxidoreductase [Woeseiaceae bacterium]